MKQIQYVSKYLTLSEEGLVSKMVCPLDQGPLFPNQTLDDQVFLYCLSCNYKKTMGAELYSRIVAAVKRVSNE